MLLCPVAQGDMCTPLSGHLQCRMFSGPGRSLPPQPDFEHPRFRSPIQWHETQRAKKVFYSCPTVEVFLITLCTFSRFHFCVTAWVTMSLPFFPATLALVTEQAKRMSLWDGAVEGKCYRKELLENILVGPCFKIWLSYVTFRLFSWVFLLPLSV